MLIIVEDRNVHALLEPPFNFETLGCLDILEVDTTKTGFKTGDNIDQLIRICLVDLDIKYIDTGKLFKQHPLTFHHRLGSQWTDITQTKHCGAIGDHCYQITSGRHFRG